MLQLQRFEILKLRLMFKMFLPETNFSGLQVKMLSLYLFNTRCRFYDSIPSKTMYFSYDVNVIKHLTATH